MAGKYHYISALAEMTAADIVKNENEWTRFLTTAARLYKYPFNEQMLIYAQRPDATACASLETWNEKMNCWVNRGAKGIALIDTDSERSRLKYVFDEYSCAMKSHFRKFGNQMSGSGNHLCNYASLLA